MAKNEFILPLSKDLTPSFHRIPSLRPPRIPVTLNRRALMQNACAQNMGAFSIKKAMQKTSLSAADMGSVEKQKMKKELTKAHRSLETMCDRMWFKQNELFRQLCKYKKLKREAVRRVYQLHQEELRDDLRSGNKMSIASFFTDLDSTTDEHNLPEVEIVPFVLPDTLAAESEESSGAEVHIMHLDTILKPADAVKVRRSLSSVPKPSADLEKSLTRSITLGNQRSSRISLPTIIENLESPSRPASASASVHVTAREVDTGIGWQSERLKKQLTIDDRKALIEPFNMYRIDEHGELVAREAKPRSFEVQMPTGKFSYRRRKLLEKERSNYQECLKRVESFNPEVQSVELKSLRGPSTVALGALPERRSSKYEFVSWVPM